MKRRQNDSDPGASSATTTLTMKKQKQVNPTWLRPPVDTAELSSSSDLVFQQVEIDYVAVERTSPSDRDSSPADQQLPHPVVRIFGCTEAGHSVMVNVHGYAPYVYARAPPGFVLDDCGRFRQQLEEQMRRVGTANKTARPNILGVELEMCQSLIGFHGKRLDPFLKITCCLPKQVVDLRRVLEGAQVWGRVIQPFEADILFPMRFMVDKGMVGCGWVRLPKDKWKFSTRPTSRCQIEVEVSHANVENLGVEGEWSKIAPLRILSFDIECASRKGLFPEAERDPVIQIANLLTVQGEQKPQVRNVLTLRSCSNIAGADVLCFEDERDLLRQWRDFVQAADPDVVIGYNIVNFDFPYLIDRAAALKVQDFPFLGRMVSARTNLRDAKFSSRAYGTRESKEISLEGRVPFDILQVMQREQKLRSYSLNFVSATFLGEQKEEVVHTDISKLFAGSDDDRRRLAIYCIKDAYLPQRLCDKLMLLINAIEMARATGIPFSYLLPHGQQIKVMSQLYRKCTEARLRIPYVPRGGTAATAGTGDDEDGDGEKAYTGAVVIEPVRGYHDVPVATLDFNSLYPSIMMSHNICYSTLLPKAPEERAKLCPNEDDYEVTPNGDHFVKTSVCPGVLPSILQDLLAARKRAKQLLAQEKDPQKRAVYDGRQLALKICANSVYGFTGAQKGKLPCMELAASVTAYGRDMIQLTKSLVEQEYSTAKGFEADAKVVYGDTDSVMVRFEIMDMERVMKLGREAAAMVTKHFPRPINLEFEKAYFPFLLINKKRYAGLLWTEPTKWAKIDAKGIETVRRDSCGLVKYLMDASLKKILVERDINGAVAFVKETVSSLLQNKLDLSVLVISKALSKEGKDYAAKQAHVELARRMHQRDPATAPGIGDRVPYVIIQASKTSKTYEKAEDPLYVLEKNLPLDYDYYIENQLKKPVRRIFKPILGPTNVGQLFSGDHTRVVVKATPNSGVGGISAFTTRTLRCLSCKGALVKGTEAGALCETCSKEQGKEAELYVRQLEVVSDLEQKFCRVWAQCQCCMQSLHQPIMCTNRDCPVFYMRAKVRKDLQEAQEVLDRFTLTDW